MKERKNMPKYTKENYDFCRKFVNSSPEIEDAFFDFHNKYTKETPPTPSEDITQWLYTSYVLFTESCGVTVPQILPDEYLFGCCVPFSMTSRKPSAGQAISLKLPIYRLAEKVRVLDFVTVRKPDTSRGKSYQIRTLRPYTNQVYNKELLITGIYDKNYEPAPYTGSFKWKLQEKEEEEYYWL
jgi:hypothetical protein